MPAPFEITSQDICDLDERQLPNLLRRLLIGEARRHALAVKHMHVPELISMPDGGEDARIELEQQPPAASRLKRKLTGFQCTISKLSVKECVEKLRRPRSSTLQPQVEEIVNAGGEFLLLLTQDLTEQAIQERVSAMSQAIAQACKSDFHVRVFDANHLRDWCNEHFAAIVAVQNWRGRPQIQGLVTFEDWNRYPAYETPLDRTSHVDRRISSLREALLATGRKVLRVRPSDDRILMEALRPVDLAQRVVYIDLHGERVHMANKLVSFRSGNFDGILVANNCPYDEYLSMKTEAEHSDSRIMVVALTSHPDQVAAHELLIERSSALDAGDFERVIEFGEHAVRLARTAEEREELTLALRCVIVDLTDSIAFGSRDRRESERRIARIRTHLEEFETLEPPKAQLLLEKASFAQLEGRSEDAFQYAELAIGEAEDLKTEAEATLFCLRASWHEGMKDQGLRLRERVASLSSRLESGDEMKLLLGADWLSTLCRAEMATIDDVRNFAADARASATTRKAVMVVGKLASDFGRANDLKATRLLLQLGMDLSVALQDPLIVANIVLDIASVEAELGNATEAIQQLGVARTWVDKLKSPGATGNWASTLANTLRAKAQVFSRLADNTEESEYGKSIDFRRSAYHALIECVEFTAEHEAEISGPVGAFRAELDAALGRAAANLGRNTEAALLFRRARTEQVMSDEDSFRNIGARAYVDEACALFFCGRVAEARALLVEIIARPSMPKDLQKIAQNNLKILEKSVVPVVDWLASETARTIAATVARTGLRSAVAEQTQALGEWIDELSSELTGTIPFAGLFDQWGRGGFARLVAAVRADPLNAVSVDATCIADIDQMARIFCPLYDTVIVSWKGPLEGKYAIFQVSGSSRNCGIGYSLLSMSHDSAKGPLGLGGWANLLPDDVATYLGTVALPLITSGRLVVVPAPLVGCTQSVVGWTDNLLVDNLLGGVVKSVKRTEPGQDSPPVKGASQVQDLGMLQLPVIDGVSLGDLGTILDDTAEWISPLRLLLRRSLGSADMRQERWGGLGPEINDLRDALRHLDEKWNSAVRVNANSDARVVSLSGVLSAVQRPEDSPGTEALTSFLRAIAGSRSDLGPWLPFWRFHNIGAQINWVHPLDNHSTAAPLRLVRSGGGIDPNNEGWLYPGEGGPGVRRTLRVPIARE